MQQCIGATRRRALGCRGFRGTRCYAAGGSPSRRSRRSRVTAERVTGGNLGQGDPEAVWVLDPHLDQVPGLRHRFPHNRDSGLVGAGVTPNISVRLHTEAVDGQGTGRLERPTPRDNRSGGTQTVPAPALFVLIGDGPRTRWLQETIDCHQRGCVLTGRDLVGAKPPPATHHRSGSVGRYVGHMAGSPSTSPGRQGGDHDVMYVGMRKAMRATVVLEGGDHPALGLDWGEPAEARVLQELERRIVS